MKVQIKHYSNKEYFPICGSDEGLVVNYGYETSNCPVCLSLKDAAEIKIKALRKLISQEEILKKVLANPKLKMGVVLRTEFEDRIKKFEKESENYYPESTEEAAMMNLIISTEFNERKEKELSIINNRRVA